MPDSGPSISAITEPSKWLPILFVIVNIVLLWVIYVMFHCVPILADISMPGGASLADRAKVEIVIFNILTAMIIICFVRACWTNPGNIPTKENGDITWEYKQGSAQSLANSMGSMLGLGLQEAKKSGERRHCKWCAKYKPDRAHHCRTCRTCILKMDHHCPWIANCVGFGNHKYFFLLLLYTTLATNMIIWSMLASVQTSVDTTVPFTRMFMLIFGETLASFLALVVTVFFLFHIWLMFKGMTTIEFCEKSMKRNWDISIYNRGCYGNVCAVLGDNPMLWLLPLSPPTGDGMNFSRTENTKLLKDMEPGRGMRRIKMKAKAPKRSKFGICAGTGEYAGSETSGPGSALSSTISLTSHKDADERLAYVC